MSYDWEVLSKFFSVQNIEPNWLYCNDTLTYYILNGCKLLKLTEDSEPELMAE